MRLAVLALATVALCAAGGARAAGELVLLNWANYTSPALVEKFEAAHDVEVTVAEFASNAEVLERVRAGGHGADAAVLSADFVRAFVEAGLALRTRPDRMENFRHVAQAWRDPAWDPGRRHSVPWQWGSLGVVVDTAVYQGEIDTAGVIFDPPPELAGRINVAPAMGEVIGTALMYLGAQPCTRDRAALEKARELLLAARPGWLTMDYGLAGRMPRGDVAAALYWSDAAFRARRARPSIRFGYPREGFPVWMDNVVVLKDARNVENARLFQDFVMHPENAALISAFAGSASGIEGAAAFLPEELRGAPELVAPEGAAQAAVFLPECPPAVRETYADIWTELTR